jgi:hypothetical protein
MGKALIAVFLVACQPMYKPDAPRLRDPKQIHHVEAKTEVPYVETCTVDFSAPPVKRRQTAAASQLVVTADSSLDTARQTSAEPAKVALIKTGIEKYGEALVKDPYNPDVTLKLALAYDSVLHKGCALAMLTRLYKLSSNPTFQASASIDRVVDNKHWFKGYREAALHAVGH